MEISPIFQSPVLLILAHVLQGAVTQQCHGGRSGTSILGWMLTLSFFANVDALLAITDTLRSRFGHFTANDKLRCAVNGFTLPVCPYLGLKIRGW